MEQVKRKPKLVIASIFCLLLIVAGYLVLRPTVTSFPPVTLFEPCSVDAIVGATKVESKWITKTGTELRVQGWSADYAKNSIASEVSVQLIDLKNHLLQSWVDKYTTSRPDVVAAFNNVAMERSGFDVLIGSISQAGSYKLQLGSINGGEFQICKISAELIVQE